MKRKLSVERLYTLGDFQNIKFASEISDIPDEHVLNDDVIQMLYYGQFLDCDIAYKKYVQMRQALAENKTKDVLTQLEEERVNTQKHLAELIKLEIDKE